VPTREKTEGGRETPGLTADPPRSHYGKDRRRLEAEKMALKYGKGEVRGELFLDDEGPTSFVSAELYSQR